MKNCSHCHQPLLEDARFCHHCGARVEEPEPPCPACGKPNPADARFCAHCGHALSQSEDPGYDLPEPRDIADRFFLILQETIREEQDATTYGSYLQRFRDSDFQQEFDHRMEQLAEQAGKLAQDDRLSRQELERFLLAELRELSDYFILHYCRDLLTVHIPEQVLRYQKTAPEAIDHYQMVMDFLHFESVPEKVYTNLLEMPVEKLRNATQAYLFPDKSERIYFICDLSLLGNCKEGFALTDQALYWRSPLEKPRKLRYADLQAITREKDWLRINGLFFNASPTLNIRLLKLLRKLMEGK